MSSFNRRHVFAIPVIFTLAGCATVETKDARDEISQTQVAAAQGHESYNASAAAASGGAVQGEAAVGGAVDAKYAAAYGLIKATDLSAAALKKKISDIQTKMAQQGMDDTKSFAFAGN